MPVKKVNFPQAFKHNCGKSQADSKEFQKQGAAKWGKGAAFKDKESETLPPQYTQAFMHA